jgi:flagellar motor switch protein FliM
MTNTSSEEVGHQVEDEYGRFTKDELKNLVSLAEYTVKSLHDDIRAAYKDSQKVELEVVHMEEMRIRDFTNALPEGAALIALRVAGLRGHMVLDIPDGLYQELVKQQFVNSKRSNLDMSIIDILRPSLQKFAKLFLGICPETEFKLLEAIQMDARIHSLPEKERAVLMAIDVTIDEVAGVITLLLPLKMVEQYRPWLKEPDMLAEWFWR